VSGLAYAAVLIGLRMLRDVPSYWLTLLNHLASAAVLLPFVLVFPIPSPAQLVVLVFYGTLQMGLPYWLAARGMRSVSPHEAGAITLLEPLLNPLWAWIISGELPERFVVIGGILILGALIGRYTVLLILPRGRALVPSSTASASNS
jgi:DME family drug/metabolite transporter